MKILQEGTPSEPLGPWWAGRKISCACGAEVLLEASDNVYEKSSKRFKGLSTAKFSCPSCGATLSLEKSPSVPPSVKTYKVTKTGVMPTLKGHPQDVLLFEDEERESHSQRKSASLPSTPPPQAQRVELIRDSLFKVPSHRASSVPSLQEPIAPVAGDPSRVPWAALFFIGLGVLGVAVLSYLAVKQPQVPPSQFVAPVESRPELPETIDVAVAVERIQTSVQKFFAATTVEEMAQHVRHPERVRPLMVSHYSQHPLQPCPTPRQSGLQSIELMGKGSFWRQNVELADKAQTQVIVEMLQSGEVKVDWETFVCYQPTPWRDYAEQVPTGDPLDFRVFMQEDGLYLGEFSDSSVWQCYQLTSMQSPERIYGYVKKADPLAQEISSLLAKYGASPPMPILRLRAPLGIQAKRSVQIEKIISPQWVCFDAPSS